MKNQTQTFASIGKRIIFAPHNKSTIMKSAIMNTLFRNFRTAFAVLTCSLALWACSDEDEDIIYEPQHAEVQHECLRPDYLQPGDMIAVVSPAYITDDASIQQGMEAVRNMGFQPVLAPNANSVYLERYAGTLVQRASDLEWAYSNPQVKAIMATRGGYGTLQLLPLLKADMPHDHPKWLIGYSDITTLLAYSVTAGVMAIHGTMLSSLKNSGGTGDDDLMLKNMLMGIIPTYEWASEGKPNRAGTAKGMLVGGNMCTFTPLIGSAYDFTAKGDIILFVEEVGENARNIDRMMYTLKLHGVLSRVKGILVGDFSGCGDEFKIGSIEEMLDKYTLSDVRIPIAYGFHAGHAGTNWPLIEGAPATLSVSADHASLTFDVP